MRQELEIGDTDLFGFLIVDERQEGIAAATRDAADAMQKR
jgi:hypothetical protein